MYLVRSLCRPRFFHRNNTISTKDSASVPAIWFIQVYVKNYRLICGICFGMKSSKLLKFLSYHDALFYHFCKLPLAMHVLNIQVALAKERRKLYVLTEKKEEYFVHKLILL